MVNVYIDGIHIRHGFFETVFLGVEVFRVDVLLISHVEFGAPEKRLSCVPMCLEYYNFVIRKGCL